MNDTTRDRLRKVEALIARGATEGERAAAREAKRRIMASLGQEPEPESNTTTSWEAAAKAAREFRAAFDADLQRWHMEAEARRQRQEAEAERKAAETKRSYEAHMRREQEAKNAAFIARPANQRLLAQLRFLDGATVAQLCDVLGWSTHTVRGALSRLKAAGCPVRRIGKIWYYGA